MKEKDKLSKTLTIIGTVLVWIPLLAPFILGLILLIMDDIYRFDFLMPMELGVLVFGSGALLLWAAIRSKIRWPLIAGGLTIAVISMGILISLGDIDPESQQLMIVIGLLVAYSLAIVLMGTGGILLWRDLSRKSV